MKQADEPSVVKVIELIGSSRKGWQDAANNAVQDASKTLRNIKGIDMVKCTAKVKNGKIVEYRSVVKLAFIVDRDL